MQPSFTNATAYLSELKRALELLNAQEIENAVRLVKTAWEQGRQIITLGNGGSALTALHYITDWNKSLFLATGKPFRGRTLVDNLGLLTAYANDVSYADIFVEQLKNILQTGDLVIAISGSGNSENVIRAVDYANEQGAVVLGVCGYSGGRLKDKSPHVLWAPIDDMQLSEDMHCIFGHIIMRVLMDTARQGATVQATTGRGC
jgi:D-sedoheptulose 7-phosphate isomerase